MIVISIKCMISNRSNVGDGRSEEDEGTSFRSIRGLGLRYFAAKDVRWKLSAAQMVRPAAGGLADHTSG